MSLSNIIKVFEKLGFVNKSYFKDDKNKMVHFQHSEGIEVTIVEDEFGTVTTKLIEVSK